MGDAGRDAGGGRDGGARVYRNPVFDREFPDPFVLKFRGEYWGYCTGRRGDGRCFGVIRSRDLVHWEEVGSAMDPLPGDWPHYWAPEVFYDNGEFRLYYSAGDEVNMQIRVAVARDPAGPFVDSGRRLTREQFAIDAHVFEDERGDRYLFYATDFLDYEFVGTGTVVDRMLDPYTLVGRPRPVTRAKYDWQVYDPNRAEKGGVRWHTVEGPFVLARKGLYYEMFSGGNWQNVSYGVSYAASDTLERECEWPQACDGDRVQPILRTIPGEVVGPGHNSVVRGPDNRQPYCVYHAWSRGGSERVLSIDPLDWAGDRMLVLGPSTAPVPAPIEAGVREAECGRGRRVALGGVPFLLEVSVAADIGARCGVALCEAGGRASRVLVDAGERAVTAWGRPVAPREGFDPGAFHLLRIEWDGRALRARLDGIALGSIPTREPLAEAVLECEAGDGRFAGLEVTFGWEDLFDAREDETDALAGWSADRGAWRVAAGELALDADPLDSGASDSPAHAGAWGWASKANPFSAFELVVNARLGPGDGGELRIYPVATGDGGEPAGAFFALARRGGRWALSACNGEGLERAALALPDGFDASALHQFRFRKMGRALSAWIENVPFGVVAVTATGPARVALAGRGAPAFFEMVRLTALPDARPGEQR